MITKTIKNVKTWNSYGIINSPLFWILGLYIFMYLPQCFIMLEDMNIVRAFEVDPGSILDAINKLFKGPYYYSMYNGYHSYYYGWTFFSINFFVILPIKVLFSIFNITSPETITFVVRFVLFLIGFGSVFAFYNLVKKATGKTFVAAFLSLFIVVSTVASKGYYFIHPETTGVLFSITGCFALLEFISQKKNQNQWFIFGLTALVLSALSKQIFLIISFPLLALFLYFRAQTQNKSVLAFLKTNQFKNNFFFTCTWSLLLLFMVHPYAFIAPYKFIKSQLDTIIYHTSVEHTFSLTETMKIWWITIIHRMPLYSFTVISAPLCLFVCYKSRQIYKKSKILYTTNLLSIIGILFVVSYIERAFPGQVFYLYPLLPYVLLNIGAIIWYVLMVISRPVRFIITCFIFCIGFLFLAFNYMSTNQILKKRLDYKDSMVYKVYNYIRSELPKNSRIAHDHVIAVPLSDGYKSCHYWNSCASLNAIKDYDPDYIIFNKEFNINGKAHNNTENLKKYILRHDYKIRKVLNMKENPTVSISIYERPKN